MSDRADELHAAIAALVAQGAPAVFMSCEDYELLVSEAPVVITKPGPLDPVGLLMRPTACGAEVEWRMFYHGPPTAEDPAGTAGLDRGDL